MKIFDSHAHYFDAWFNEYEGGAEALLDRLFFSFDKLTRLPHKLLYMLLQF